MTPRVLFTTSDVGAALGVTRRRGAVIVRRPAFPAPYAVTPHGIRLWRPADVERFAAMWDRRTGRPPREVVAR